MRLGLWKKGLGAEEPDAAALARIKAQTREILGLEEDASISANEIVCADPACPGTETVILVMIPGRRTRAYKVQLPAADVTIEALREALTA
ncbi:MAG: hypothetical protein HEQ16_16420 [Bosea sp.]|jgi:hypothetical protein|nr:hypothetical protein [Bosea sp. (in: a-proteobacteria)]